VESGQPVVALSAMKMELVCEAPSAGFVETLSCALDQIVAADDVLATIRVEAESQPTEPGPSSTS
jgi:biotin carboxyl carrier protein